MPITHRTGLLGIIGYPIGHSLSPAMQNAALEATDLDMVYIAMEVPPRRLSPALGAMRALKFRGFNVTIPHKERIIPYLDRLTPEARLIGAVNTVLNRSGRWIGHNTDGRGFSSALSEAAGFSVRERRVFILGAGGAARAVAFRSALEGAAEVTVANRTAARAVSLIRDLAAGRFGLRAVPLGGPPRGWREAVRRADLVVQATSLGMRPDDPLPLPRDYIRAGQVVCDLVTSPPDTPFLKGARGAGAITVNGIGMLVHQGAISFKIWTDREAPLDLMKAAVVRVSGARSARIR